MDRLNLNLDIRTDDIGTRRINVRSSLLVANLLAEIQDKFNIDGSLQLMLDPSAGPLSLRTPLGQAGVAEGATLICERMIEESGTLEAIQRGMRIPFEEHFSRVYLTEEHSLTEYDLAWQPAIVGRRDHRNPSNNRLLAVDLEDIEDLPTVSRHHACITLTEGTFFFETIQPRNPTYLDGSLLKPGIRYPLAAGSVVQVGRVSLTFQIVG